MLTLAPGEFDVDEAFAELVCAVSDDKNDPDGNFALIMHAWHDGRTSFAMISGFVMENVIDQFEVAPC